VCVCVCVCVLYIMYMLYSYVSTFVMNKDDHKSRNFDFTYTDSVVCRLQSPRSLHVSQ